MENAMEHKFSDKEYDALTARLFSRFPSFQKKGSEAYKPGLERVVEMCRRMGVGGLTCIHVAGTNGKGSTCNMIAAALSSCGLETGLYTSPHILDFRERMRIVSKRGVTLISKRQVWDFLHRWGKEIDELDLSLFEITTVMAFDFFAGEGVDVAVIETGLGGRMDATNVVVPEVSVITNIGLDHTDLLGGTLPEIAYEKAGIIKDGVPVVVGEYSPETFPVFEKAARLHNAPLRVADREKYALGEEVAGSVMDAQAFETLLSRMDLQGSYQAKNLRTVLCTLAVLSERRRESEGSECYMSPLGDADLLGSCAMDAIARAAQICQFHGRWEKVCDNPVTICDIGHNEHGLKYNFAQLEQMLESGEYTDLVMVYGSVRDKDVDAVLRIIPRRARIFFTNADNQRAMPAEEIKRRYEALCLNSLNGGIFPRKPDGCGGVFDRVPDAVEAALECCAGLVRPLLYIGGSTYLVSEAVAFLGTKRVRQ